MKPLRELIKEPLDALDKFIIGWNLKEIKNVCKRKNSYDSGFMAGVRSQKRKYEKRLKIVEKRLKFLEIRK